MADINQWRRPPAAFREKVPWIPHTLPDGPNIDGRPVWEPPIFEYSLLIAEEYDRQREAVLNHTDDNAAETTSYMDVAGERHLLQISRDWAAASPNAATTTGIYTAAIIAGSSETETFYDGLLRETMVDLDVVHEEHIQFGFKLIKRKDGSSTYRVVTGPAGDYRGRSSWIEDGGLKDDDVYRLSLPLGEGLIERRTKKLL